MHWLHVNSNSDFLTFCNFLALFFGRISVNLMQIFGRYFVKKYLKLWHLSFFRQIVCTWQTLSIFWFLEIKKYLTDFWNLLTFCFSSEYILEQDLRVANALANKAKRLHVNGMLSKVITPPPQKQRSVVNSGGPDGPKPWRPWTDKRYLKEDVEVQL